MDQRWTSRTKSRHSDHKDKPDTTKGKLTEKQKAYFKQYRASQRGKDVQKKYRASQKFRDAQQRYKERYPEKTWAISSCASAKRRAKKFGVPYDINAAYVVSIIEDRCPVFGTKFKFSGNKHIRPYSPTIDRLIPKKGYVKGNVVVISCRANQIKGANSANSVHMVYKWMKKLGLK